MHVFDSFDDRELIQELLDGMYADTAEVTEIANHLKKYPSHFATCHCTGIPVYTQMKEIMGDQLTYVRSGDEVVV